MFLFKKIKKAWTRPSPLAPETIEFEGIAFRILRRPRRRQITISLKTNGSAKILTWMGCSQREIQNFLIEKRQWILSAKQNFGDLRQKYPKLLIQAGVQLPLLGRPHVVTIEHKKQKTVKLKVLPNFFVLEVPTGIQNIQEPRIQEKLRQTLRTHYRKISVELLRRRTDFWTEKTGLRPTGLSFRGQKTRWGSCSPMGQISLNWKLICADPGVIDYVIIHELCHLAHMNHSPKFWNLVALHCPDWKDKKRWLQKRVFEFDFLNDKSELHQD